MARYSRDAYSFSVSINNADTAGNADTIGNADTADIGGSVHVDVAHRLTEHNGFAVEPLCFAQEHHASCNPKADGETRDSERGLKADQ
jgi:hypothetical protein